MIIFQAIKKSRTLDGEVSAFSRGKQSDKKTNVALLWAMEIATCQLSYKLG